MSVNFKDLVRKALPISKRGARWIDWNNTATSPIRELNAMYDLAVTDWDFYKGTSIQSKAMPVYLNDLFDPLHRGIFITDNNDIDNQIHFTVSIPTYLAFGDYEEVITQAISRYLYIGIHYDFATYSAGFTHEAEDYLNHIVSGLGGSDTLSDTEIWAVQYLYNQLKGADILKHFSKLHLFSLTNQSNSLVDFIDPVGSDLTVVGSPTWDNRGFKGGSGNYLTTGWIPSVQITSSDNWCTVLHCSQDGAQLVTGTFYGSSSAATNKDYIDFENATSEAVVSKGDPNDFIRFSNTDNKGSYVHYIDSGNMGVFKDGVLVGSEIAVSPSTLPTVEDYLLNFNDNGAPGANPSEDYISTYGQVDDPLNGTSRKFLSNVIKEFNKRLNR